MCTSKRWLPCIGLLAVLLTPVLALPSRLGHAEQYRNATTLYKRAPGGSINEPLEPTFDISGWVELAEINCFVMLCIHKTRVYRRVGNAAEAARNRDPLANLRAFYPDNQSTYGTQVIDYLATSSEDFPWASIRLGDGPLGPQGIPNDVRGLERTITGVHLDQQEKQGRAIRQGYRNAARFDQWFRITLTGPLGDVCRDLHSNPPNEERCNSPNIEEELYGRKVHLEEFVVERAPEDRQPGPGKSIRLDKAIDHVHGKSP